MKKKVISLLLCAALTLGLLAGCGSSGAADTKQEDQQSEAAPESVGEDATVAEAMGDKLPEKFKIGVVIWSTVDDLGRASAEMLDYASDVLGCEMVYNTNISSPESQITATENLIAADCDAVAICNYSDDILPKIA